MDTCKNVHHVAEKFYLLHFTKILSCYDFKSLIQDGKANCIVPIFMISFLYDLAMGGYGQQLYQTKRFVLLNQHKGFETNLSTIDTPC